MTFDEVNSRIDQPMEHDIHRGIRYLKCIMIRFIGNCNYSLKSMLVDTDAAIFFSYEVAYVLVEIINI